MGPPPPTLKSFLCKEFVLGFVFIVVFVLKGRVHQSRQGTKWLRPHPCPYPLGTRPIRTLEMYLQKKVCFKHFNEQIKTQISLLGSAGCLSKPRILWSYRNPTATIPESGPVPPRCSSSLGLGSRVPAPCPLSYPPLVLLL